MRQQYSKQIQNIQRGTEPWQISSLKGIKLLLRGKTTKNLKMISQRLEEKVSVRVVGCHGHTKKIKGRPCVDASED